MGAKKASEVLALLNLRLHPHGGYYGETMRDCSVQLQTSNLPPEYKVDRPVSSAIYFLLSSGSVAYIHRVPSAQVLHFYMGEPLTIFELTGNGQFKLTVLGNDLDAGHHLQYVVQGYVWFGCFLANDLQSYDSDGGSITKSSARDADLHFSLIGCTCAPAFQYEDAEVASLSDVLPRAPKAEAFLRYLVHHGEAA